MTTRITQSQGRLPWTREELDALAPKLQAEIRQIEEECEGVRPCPPMTAEEARDLILRYIEESKERPITEAEAMLIGQLLSCYEMGVRAETLGKPGRYFVISEEQVNNLIAEGV